MLQLPPLPGVRPPLAGRTTVSLRFTWTGEPDEGAQLLAPMREVAPRGSSSTRSRRGTPADGCRNFGASDDPAALARCCTPATQARLRRAVAAYDPHGVIALADQLR